ncbi:MAG: heparan-alpha-glucosaminide N-acetyltransferase [Pseudomonadota bacterium]|nr:heparan-alpha-glucosaminide N-acetyltransferase [Pseudomonadota bacterium]
MRHDRLDALRGLAMVWMTVYHFCFDLNHFGHIRQNFYADPLWTWQRTAIVSLFLLCAGAGQALAVAQGQGWPRFWRRWGQIAACALLVSLGSWWMFPQSWISFGVLHGMAVMLLITRVALLRGWLRGARPWGLGALLIAAGPLGSAWLQGARGSALADALNGRWLNGLGVVTHKPPTEDYVPLLPWLGVMWLGVGAAQWLAARAPQALAGTLGAPGRALAVLGRHSLLYYMLHQPVMIGALMAWGWLSR